MPKCLPEVLVDKQALADLAKRVCCNEKKIKELEENPPDCPDCPDVPPTDPEDDCEFVCTSIGFAADTGQGDDPKQLTLWDRIQTVQPDLLLIGGDNTYTFPGDCGDVQFDQEIFADYRNSETLLPAIGNHDLDIDPNSACHSALYPYLPGNRRYYTVKYPDRGLQIFVLSVGRNSAGDMLEPDGNSVDSEQYQWFISEALKSNAKWKIVMFHHPWFSQQSSAVNGSQYVSDMNWRFENYGIDLVVNGHNHLTAHHSVRGVDYIQASVSVRSPRQVRTDSNLTYGLPDGGALVYQDVRAGDRLGQEAMAFIGLTENAMYVEIVDTPTGDPIHTFGRTNDRRFTCLPVDDVPCPCSNISYTSI